MLFSLLMVISGNNGAVALTIFILGVTGGCYALSQLPTPVATLAGEAAGEVMRTLSPRWGAGRHLPTQRYDAHSTLLAQHESTTHRPVGYASSPSLPGTLNTPW